MAREKRGQENNNVWLICTLLNYNKGYKKVTEEKRDENEEEQMKGGVTGGWEERGGVGD